MTKQKSFFLQLGPHDCALACMRMVLKYHGFTPPLSTLIHLFPVSFGGISLFDLENSFSKLGFDTATIKLDISAIVESDHLPVILYLSENHFVVLYNQVDEDTYLLGDPGIGSRTISREELEDIWYLPKSQKGIALLVEPKELDLQGLTYTNPPELTFVEFFNKKKQGISNIRLKQSLSIVFQALAFAGAALSLYVAARFDAEKGGAIFLFVFFTTLGILSEIISQRAITSVIQLLQTQIRHEFSSRFLNNANTLLDPWIQSWSVKNNWLIESFLQTKVRANRHKYQQLIVFGLVLIGLFVLHWPTGILTLILALFLALSLWLLKYFGHMENIDYFEKSLKSYDLYRKIVANRLYVQIFNANQYFKNKWEKQEVAAHKDRNSFQDKQLFHYLLRTLLVLVIAGIAIGVTTYWHLTGQSTSAVFLTSIFLILVSNIPFYFLLRSDNLFQQESFANTLEDYWELATSRGWESESTGPFHQLTLPAPGWGISCHIKKGDKVALVTDNLHDRNKFFEKLINEPVALNFGNKNILRRDFVSQLSYIDESAKIYEDSLKNNILFGHQRPLNSILQSVGLEEEIKNQVSGIETLLQTDYISAILKLKLLAARAISKQAPLTLINLDLKPAELPEEGKIIQQIIHFLAEKTVIWFASNPMQIPKDTTKVIVFKNGEILESGSPEQLTIIKGYFYRFNKHSSFG